MGLPQYAAAAVAAFAVAAAGLSGVIAQSGEAVSVEGLVVDAACFMLHPEAADGPTHDECGQACALAGVPLGVYDAASKQLYLADAAGTKQLLPHLHQRTRVQGRATRMTEALTLQKPVGEHNTMTVRVDGGYMALTIERIDRAR